MNVCKLGLFCRSTCTGICCFVHMFITVVAMVGIVIMFSIAVAQPERIFDLHGSRYSQVESSDCMYNHNHDDK